MPILRRLACLSLFICLFSASTALAGQVTVSIPADEDVSAMALREKAMAEGFARAVVNEAETMLPASLDETRAILLEKYYFTRARPYIQGYKVLVSKITDEGVFIGLDVSVNRKNLRHNLESIGLFRTVRQPVVASISYPDDLDDESMNEFQGLVTLTGVRPGNNTDTDIALERGPENTYRVRLKNDGEEWVSIQKDMNVAWFNVWKRYFRHNADAVPQTEGARLAVSGWFSPDAALEFDRVLRGWDSAVEDVQLMQLDMQSTGVAGTWILQPVNSNRLTMLLKSYLPQRGLTYQLSEGGRE